jgi:hypothetical protein
MPKPEPKARRLDTPQVTLNDIDQRVGQAIAAEHQFITDILAEIVAHLQDEIKKEAAGEATTARRARSARQAGARQVMEAGDRVL